MEALRGLLAPDASAHGWQIDRLLLYVHAFMAAVFLGWLGYYIYCLIRFRARPGHAASRAEPRARATFWIEGAVVLIELLLLAGLSMPAWTAWKEARPEEKTALHVRLVAQQYVWNFHYPGRDGRFGKASAEQLSDDNPLGLDRSDPAGKDDVTTLNELHVPVGRPVILEVMSMDVIHGFNVPALRVKQDAIPGQSVPVWFTATKAGRYEIACAQLCGLGHYRMRGEVVAESAAEFEAWLASQSPEAK
jgi:cytochrome c oxidase subunit II